MQGLLSVHQHLLNNLDTRARVETGLLKFHFNDQVIKASTWASIQEASQGETLEIWLNEEFPKIHVPDARQQESRSQPMLPLSDQDRKYTPLDPVPIVLPFLAWPVVDDDDREVETHSSNERASRFLYAIYRTLPAKCATDVVEQKSSTTRSSLQADVTIQGKKYSDLNIGLSNTVDSITQREIIHEARMLLNNFLMEHDNLKEDQSPPIRLFWGALYEILADHAQSKHRGYPRLPWLAETLSKINTLAEKIHLGVHYRRSVDSNSEANQDAIGTYAILLDSIVDALAAVFRMLIETVRVMRLDHTVMRSKNESKSLENAPNNFAHQACESLVQARDQLIVEANRVLPDGELDLIASPEAIIVTLMERLINGVFGDGVVNVIGIYDAVMEHLVSIKIRVQLVRSLSMLFKQNLQVRHRSSFRWLQALHQFEEELDIVRRVLLHQERVLTTFCSSLNPDSFGEPSVIRKMSFVFRRNQIERLLSSIRDRILDCLDLKERCSVLAYQNVQLVQAMHGVSLRIGVGRLFNQVVHGTSKAISRHLPSRRTPANLQSTRDDLHMRIAPFEHNTPDSITTQSISSRSMTDQQQGEILIEETSKTTLSEQFNAYFQQNHFKNKRDFLSSTLDLLWQHFPERKDLEGKIYNPDDPGDGLIYDQPQIQEAKSILTDLHRSWSAAEIRRGLPSAAPRLPELAKICLILGGMHQQKLLE